MSELPAEVSRVATVAFLADAFEVDADRLVTAEFDPSSHPVVTVMDTDIQMPVRLCEALGIDPDGLAEGMRVDRAGVTVTLRDGETQTIPFDEELP